MSQIERELAFFYFFELHKQPTLEENAELALIVDFDALLLASGLLASRLSYCLSSGIGAYKLTGLAMFLQIMFSFTANLIKQGRNTHNFMLARSGAAAMNRRVSCCLCFCPYSST